MLKWTRLNGTEQPCRLLSDHCPLLKSQCLFIISHKSISKLLCEAVSISWMNESTIKHKMNICISKTSGRNALRTLKNTCDHWYDIVITKEGQHSKCFPQLPQWKFRYLASSWAFQHGYCFHSQLWLTCMYRVHLSANTLLRKSIKQYV